MSADGAAAARWARDLLDTGLAPTLTYHCLAHTESDVVPAAERLADLEGLGPDDRLVLRTAAWFHDIGFVVRADGHEEIGIAFAEDVLPELGYGSADVANVAELIRATKLPQKPTSHLAALLADADLDVLGREDFAQRNEALRLEQAAPGPGGEERDWLVQQIDFLASHRYHTATARSLRDGGKERNLGLLRARLVRLG